MLEFSYQALPWNVVFGAGRRTQLPAELDRLGLSKALVLCTPNQDTQAEEIADLLGYRFADVFDQAKMHVPAETVHDAAEMAAKCNADCTVAIGGGSTTGLGKALALSAKLPNVAIPTTYAGSEMTNIWGITENNKKMTGRDPLVLPDLTIYDPELTLSLPAHIAAPSGINAMAQAVVNVATDKPNPIISVMGVEAVSALAKYLPMVIDDGADIEARSGALYGACLAGAALGTGATSLHHRLCHTLGGRYNTPHAETHAILLPHTLSYNLPYTTDGAARLSAAIGQENPALGIFELLDSLGISQKLSDIGISAREIDEILDISLEKSLNNPAPLDRDKLTSLLQNAIDGRPPASFA